MLCCKSPAHLYVRDEEQKNNETLLLGTHFGTECKFFFRRRLYSFLDLRNILVCVKAREKVRRSSLGRSFEVEDSTQMVHVKFKKIFFSL